MHQKIQYRLFTYLSLSSPFNAGGTAAYQVGTVRHCPGAGALYSFVHLWPGRCLAESVRWGHRPLSGSGAHPNRDSHLHPALSLWDIDTLINKALVYGLLTGLLAALFVGLVFGLDSLIGIFTRQTSQPVVTVISTLTIAALFQPLRWRIQSLIDRRFYRRKYDAEKMLAVFSSTLRTDVNLEDLSNQLLTVVQETMQPEHVSLWLRRPARNPKSRE